MSMLVELVLTVVLSIVRVSTLWDSTAGKSTSRLKYVQRQQIFISQCNGSKKLRQQSFEDPPAPEGPSPSFVKIPSNLTSFPCELRSGNTESAMEKDGDENRRDQQYQLFVLQRFQAFCITLQELILKLYDGNTEVHCLGIAFRKIPRLW